MRQFAGFGTAEDTNRRYKFLLSRGQTGLSVAFDFPTLMGYDSDHPRAEGERQAEIIKICERYVSKRPWHIRRSAALLDKDVELAVVRGDPSDEPA